MSKKPDTASRMADILAANRLAELSEPETPSPAPAESLPSRVARPVVKSPVQPEAVSEERAKQVGPGRPLGSKRAKPGKKDNAEYCATTIYIRKATRKRVQLTLLDAESDDDVSDLVEVLLQEWLEKQD